MNELVLDISMWQGNVDMAKVKKAGVYGIIQRVGYGTNTLDKTAYTNIDNALKQGLKVGAYWFIYAYDEKEALIESNNFINMIKKYDGKLELPLYADLEYDTDEKAKKAGRPLTKETRTRIVEVFLDNLKSKGYYPGVYSNLDYLNNYFDKRILDKYDLWLAHYSSTISATYKSKAKMWQYTSQGKIDGITENTVDCNKMLVDYPSIIKSGGYNKLAVSSKNATAIVAEAQKWIGTKQGDSNHKAIVDGYNSISPLPVGYKVTYTDSWCDAFVSFVFKQVGALNLVGGGECGVERHIQIFKNLGIWIEDGTVTPKVGDIITYNWDKATQPNDGFADHIGIVEKVSGTSITIIEGNIDAKVGRRTIQVGNGYIRGYARPKYSASSSTSPTPTPAPVKKSNTEIADEVIAGKWGTGTDRKTKLQAAGYDYNAIQKIVNDKMAKPSKKSNEEIAKEVLAGKWGNGIDRKNKLQAAGYDYNAVQKIVNSKAPATKPTHTSKSGTWKFNTAVKIRSGPSTGYTQVGVYAAGDTVLINDTSQQNGYIWGHYVSYTGYDRYVALQPIGGASYGKWM